MSHIRTQLRAAAKQALTGLATTGANVFANRTTHVPLEQRPALCIYSSEETSSLDGSSSGLRRNVMLTVDAVFNFTEAFFDAEADKISAEVETALGSARTLSGLAYDCVPVAMRLSVNADGEQSIGICSMTFMVTTRTQIGAPEAVG